MIHLDSSFLVDLLRENNRKEVGPATSFLESVSEEALWISVFVACELFAGAELSGNADRERKRITELVDFVHVAFPDARFAPEYGRLLSRQQRVGREIATMDLLIATIAILAGAPLVTRNVKHFQPLTELRLISY